MSLFAMLFVIFMESIYLRLRCASRHKFIGKKCIYEQFSLFVSCGECTHAHDICIVAESCPLSRIYIGYQRCISTRDFVCCDRYTDSGSTDQDSSIIFFSCYCLANCNCNISVDWIFTSKISYFAISFFAIYAITSSFAACAFGSHPIAIFILFSSTLLLDQFY